MNRPRNTPNIGSKNFKALTDLWAGPHPRLTVHFHQSFARSTGLPTRTDGGAEIKYDGATTHRVVVSELEHRKRERGLPNSTSCITACVDCLYSTQVEFFVIQEEGEKYINSIITLHADVLPVVNAIVDDLRTIGLASGTLQLVWTLSSSSSLALSSASSSSSKSACLCTSSGSCASHVVPLVQPPVSVPRYGVLERKSSETPLRASARIMTRKRRREEAEATTPKGDKERGWQRQSRAYCGRYCLNNEKERNEEKANEHGAQCSHAVTTLWFRHLGKKEVCPLAMRNKEARAFSCYLYKDQSFTVPSHEAVAK